MGEENKIFHRNCGEILRLALDIESTLDFFIANYFCSPQNYKTFLFKDLILMEQTGLGFKRKIEIFRKICEREKIGKERVKKIIDAIQFVTLTPHHLGNMFNPSLSSRSITFFGTSVIMPCPPTSKW
jgi:hypothetical protein